MRRVVLGIGVLTLGVGPWLAFPTVTVVRPASFFASSRSGSGVQTGQVGPQGQIGTRSGFARPAGCSCRKIVINAENVVRGADVRSGDAKVVNKSITYIAPTYGDTEVEIDQEAEARSGDAIAGQILSVSDGGDGCSQITVNATNIVEDSEVRSGDAIARNKSVVLIDPRVNREDIDIDIDQDADASSGEAIAGQIIGVNGGGGPCGGVVLDAINRVRDVDVRSGEAVTENLSEILECRDAGCLDEIRAALQDVTTVSVCEDRGCHPVPTKKFIKMLKETFEEDDPDEELDPDEEDESLEDGEGEPTPTPDARRRHRRNRDDPATDPAAVATPTPEASPTPIAEDVQAAPAEPA